MSDKKATVLVIDDEASILDVLRVLLQNEGFNVIVASDGQSGLDLAKQHVPDVIILDVMMPKMSGYMVANLLAKDMYLKDIPVILLTAATHYAGNIPIEVNAKLKLSKPFQPDVLLDALNQVFL